MVDVHRVIDQSFVVRNEFAAVHVSLDSEALGDRLRIEDLNTGCTVFLDALEAERLTVLTPDDLDRIVAPPGNTLL